MTDSQLGFIAGSLGAFGSSALAFGLYTDSSLFIALAMFLFGFSYVGPLNGHPKRASK